METSDRLLAWAGRPGPRKVLAAARRRLEAGHSASGSPLRVTLSGDERDQVGQLLGTSWTLSGTAVAIRHLEDAVRPLGWDVVRLLEAVAGPLRDRPGERAAAHVAAAAERTLARTALITAGVPAPTVDAWLAGRGLPRAGTGALARLAGQAATVYRTLPRASEPVPLPVLAVTALADTKALDRGSRIATAVLRLAAGGPVDEDPEGWRAAWESLGVICDGLSSRVLVLNLGLVGAAPACRLTAAAGAEPVWLTWRSLAGDLRCMDAVVSVCENPAVVAAAADRLGARCRPLVCTNGQPSGAARRLLARLAASGTQLRIRADDDPAGQQIVSLLYTMLPTATLWRYQLRPAPAARYEEQDLDDLLADLDRGQVATTQPARPPPGPRPRGSRSSGRPPQCPAGSAGPAGPDPTR